MTSFLTIKFALPVVSGVAIVAYIFRKYYYHEKEDFVNEVMFFCNKGIACRAHFQKEPIKKSCDLGNCSYYNLRRMIYFLNNCERSLDICLYLITVGDLCQAIIKSHKDGIKVRVITDEDMANGSGSQISKFIQIGIPVRFRRKCTTLMHHKFVIIDRHLVMTGSLNWTMQAICGNWDNLIITSQPEIVTPFVLEYERLWEDMT